MVNDTQHDLKMKSKTNEIETACIRLQDHIQMLLDQNAILLDKYKQQTEITDMLILLLEDIYITTECEKTKLCVGVVLSEKKHHYA